MHHNPATVRAATVQPLSCRPCWTVWHRCRAIG